MVLGLKVSGIYPNPCDESMPAQSMVLGDAGANNGSNAGVKAKPVAWPSVSGMVDM